MPDPHLVAVLALAPIVGFDMTIPPTVLGAATADDGTSLYDVRICGLDRSPIPSTNGYAVTPEYGAELLAHADTVIVPGTTMPGPRRDGVLPRAVTDALASIRSDARIVSICTGAFVLGAARARQKNVLDRFLGP